MNIDKCTEKCLQMLNTDQFFNLVKIQQKRQKEDFRMIYEKLNLSWYRTNINSYTVTESSSGKFYGR